MVPRAGTHTVECGVRYVLVVDALDVLCNARTCLFSRVCYSPLNRPNTVEETTRAEETFLLAEDTFYIGFLIVDASLEPATVGLQEKLGFPVPSIVSGNKQSRTNNSIATKMRYTQIRGSHAASMDHCTYKLANTELSRARFNLYRYPRQI